MKQVFAAKLCDVLGHPGLRQRAKQLAESGARSALLYWKCPRCRVEIQSIEIHPRARSGNFGKRAPV